MGAEPARIEAAAPAPNEERVLVLAPTAKDARLCEAILKESGIESEVCPDLASACSEIERGAGAALLSEEALSRGGLGRLVDTLGRQPSWSDFPLLMLTGEGADSELALRTLETLGNVTLLERPVRVPALVSAVRSALRARRRQYQIRDQIAEMKRIADTLRESDRRKDEFLAILAHELRNPLAPLSNALEAIRLADDREMLHWARGVMQRQLAQMVRLIDDLLDVSRVSRGKIKLNRERLVLGDLVRDALEVCRPAIDAAGHRLEVSLPEQGVELEGDHTRLVQVLCNLLSNATKYTPAGGRISLAARTEGSDLLLEVVDNGAGIPTEMLPKVFDLFTQVEHSLERSQGGLGIGLTLVKRLVELHEGSIDASSEGAGRGSRFVVRLPRRIRVGVVRPPRGDGAGQMPATRERRRILIADDNRDAAESLANLLRLSGHEVRTAHDGQEAVQVASQFKPAIALLDIGMPLMNGYDAAERIRALDHDGEILLVALTGWGQPEDRRRSRAAGFAHHFVKPLDPALLDRVLAEKPEKKRARL